MHDWTQVDAGIFHDFHLAWAIELRNSLNGGILPVNYYALVEQHAGRRVPDLIALHREAISTGDVALPAPAGGLAVAEAPPRVSHAGEFVPSPRALRRSIAIRHVSAHRLVGVIEIVSPGNKDRLEHVEELAGKIDGFLAMNVNVLVLDLFPPSKYDRAGIDGVIRVFHSGEDAMQGTVSYPPPCAVSYCASLTVKTYFEPFRVAHDLPDMPLFIHAQHYVNVPLESTYVAAFRGVPDYWKESLA